jgi:hypothetical protein
LEPTAETKAKGKEPNELQYKKKSNKQEGRNRPEQTAREDLA